MAKWLKSPRWEIIKTVMIIIMASFYKFAQEFMIEAENTIRAELSKRSILERLGFRVIMPLTINVVTNQGAGSLTILKDGTIRLSESLPPNPDSLIQADFETLKDLYYSRDRERFIQAEKEGRIKIIGNTLKGQQAEKKLRELLGH